MRPPGAKKDDFCLAGTEITKKSSFLANKKSDFQFPTSIFLSGLQNNLKNPRFNFEHSSAPTRILKKTSRGQISDFKNTCNSLYKSHCASMKPNLIDLKIIIKVRTSTPNLLLNQFQPFPNPSEPLKTHFRPT